MIEKSLGIVLKSIKYSDSSKIVTVYTKDFGKLAFIAKGARNSKSKFGASLELLTISEFTFYNRPNADILIVSNGDIIKSNTKLTKKSDTLLIGLMIAESLNNTQEKRNINQSLYQFTIEIIMQLSDCDTEPFNLYNKFMLGLSKFMGFGLSLNSYDRNRQDIAISLENGCLVYNNTSQRNNYKFTNSEIDYFYNLINNESLNDMVIDKKNISHFCDFWIQYFSFHLERKFVLKSANLL